ncbi:MAG: hypothetical protein ABI042_01610 [Verrucomicrobiota bacterium]
MKRTLPILNLVVAIVLIFLSIAASGAHATHAHSTYHGLVANRIILEPTTYTNGKPFDVETSLRQIGATNFWFLLLGFGGAGMCIANGLVFLFVSREKRTPEKISARSA